MATSHLDLRTPPNFDFWRTVYSHGWCALPPFRVNEEHRSLSRVLGLADGKMVLCTLSDSGGSIRVHLASQRKLTGEERRTIGTQLSESLRLTEDFSEFYATARRYPRFRWIASSGAGRLLRAPTVFEDTVKMICTTNCSWSLTEAIVGNLTSLVGEPFADGLNGFPTPAAVARLSESFVRKKIRAGYRSPYLLELAENVAGGKLDIESWRHSSLPTQELYAQIRRVKGIGEYAAGNLLKLLGRYEYLGLDSWVRGRYCDLHHNGRRVSDATIERHYARYGTWRGLFFWLEMTRHWFQDKFPF